MSSRIISLKAANGEKIEFVDEIIGAGAMKDVYFSPDKSFVAAFFRKPLDRNGRERLENITGLYRDKIFNGPHGPWWKRLFCWPSTIVEWEGRAGIVSPVYEKDFFFQSGRFQGKEKEGKWFASAKLRNRFLTPAEKGTWMKTLEMCLNIARAARRLHAAGLAHSDLSYKNVLVDPQSGRACIIDIDGLVVPGKFPPDVVGTPDFIAPEVMKTRSLPLKDPAKNLPNIATDRHALAVLIYMYLLNRHPLRGSKVHDLDPALDEELSMGEKALFIEHPADFSNRPDISQLEKWELPQRDPGQRPYSICGPYLKELFDSAFIDGLHNPGKRPTAADWETALQKTIDLALPCQNARCEANWFVFDNTIKPACPFCGAEYSGLLPVLNLYYAPTRGHYIPENYRLMVYPRQTLHAWHVNRFIVPNEKLNPEAQTPLADFQFKAGKWLLINRGMSGLRDVSAGRDIPPGESMILEEGGRILLSPENGGRLAVVQMIGN